MLPVRKTVAVVAAFFALASCKLATAPAQSGQAKIELGQGWTRETAPGQDTGGGFLTIVNSGTVADRLDSVTSPRATRVQIHEMTMDGGVMRMRPVSGGIEIAPGQSVTLAPGGFHLMLMGLRAPLKQGESVPLALHFEKAGTREAILVVRPVGANGTND